MTYESCLEQESRIFPGVSFTVLKMSFGRRVELTRRIREVAQKLEFFAAGDDPREKLQAALLSAEIELLYVLWGLKEIRGLELDGVSATPESLVAIGPEELVREVVSAVKAACGLTDIERKN